MVSVSQDSSPEVERFQISDGDWMQAMDPTRRGFRQKKKHAIYGIWASDDSDSGEEMRSGLGGGVGRRSRGGADYMAPVSFVSGGVKKGSAPPKPKPTQYSDDEVSRPY